MVGMAGEGKGVFQHQPLGASTRAEQGDFHTCARLSSSYTLLVSNKGVYDVPKDTMLKRQPSGRERRHSCSVRFAAANFHPFMDPDLSHTHTTHREQNHAKDAEVEQAQQHTERGKM